MDRKRTRHRQLLPLHWIRMPSLRGLGLLADRAVEVEKEEIFALFKSLTTDTGATGIAFYELLDTRLMTPVYEYYGDALDPPDAQNLEYLLALFAAKRGAGRYIFQCNRRIE